MIFRQKLKFRFLCNLHQSMRFFRLTLATSLHFLATRRTYPSWANFREIVFSDTAHSRPSLNILVMRFNGERRSFLVKIVSAVTSRGVNLAIFPMFFFAHKVPRWRNLEIVFDTADWVHWSLIAMSDCVSPSKWRLMMFSLTLNARRAGISVLQFGGKIMADEKYVATKFCMENVKRFVLQPHVKFDGHRTSRCGVKAFSHKVAEFFYPKKQRLFQVNVHRLYEAQSLHVR